MDKKEFLQKKLEECSNNLLSSIASVKTLHNKTIVQTEESLENMYGLVSSPWSNKKWSNFAPPISCSPPPPVRVGNYLFSETSKELNVPALVNILCERNLLIKTNAKGKMTAVKALQSVTLRLFASLPPGKIRVLFIDPVSLGENSGMFMELGDYKEDLIGRKVHWESQDIEHELATLNEHVAMIIQKYLRDKFNTIDDYNAAAGDLAEPYTVVVVFDFPTAFSEQSAELLLKVAKNGPRCGVSILILMDSEQKMPNGFDIANLEGVSTMIKQAGERFILVNDPFPDGLFDLDVLPSTDLLRNIIHLVGSAVKQVEVKASFDRIIPKPEDWWKDNTRDGIRVPIGITGVKEPIYFELGYKTAHHCLLGGVTGSGKSTLLHVLITNLALTYSPEELELYLADFKKGVEFRIYADKKLPHIRVIAIETEREFGLNMLRRLDKELKQRGELLQKENCADIREFRNHKIMPRILLLVEEFQEFFSENDAIADEAVVLIERLVRQGRSFGIHIILSSQTIAGAASRLRGAPMEQMGLRMALKCSEADSREILGPDNPAAKSLSRPGEAIYNSEGGDVDHNKFFQVAWLSDQDRNRFLERIQVLERASGHKHEPPIIFKGFEETKPEESRFLQKVLDISNWPSDYEKAPVWIGEPLAIREEPTTALFYSQSGRNLLVVGKDERMAVGMLSTALVSLILQYHPKDVKFYVIDLSTQDKNQTRIFQYIAKSLSYKIEIIEKQQQIGDVIDNVKQIMDSEQLGVSVYLFIVGLQRVRSFMQAESIQYLKEDETTNNPVQLLSNILRDGPEKNIHSLVWCDSVTNFERALRESLNEFGMRVTLPMMEFDSVKLIDSSAASKLPPYRSLFWDETRPSELEKFRPYLATETFSNLVERLKTTLIKRGA